MGVILGDFGFDKVAGLGGLSPLYMDRGGTAAPEAEAFSVVEVDASLGTVGVFVIEGSSRGRPPAVKDRQTRQKRNAV
jgi:hypothetical protein